MFKIGPKNYLRNNLLGDWDNIINTSNRDKKNMRMMLKEWSHACQMLRQFNEAVECYETRWLVAYL